MAHWSPQYALDLVRVKLFQLKHPGWPWIAPKAAELLDAHLQFTHAGFEWGAGHSTHWLGQRVGSLTSVEHDPGWYERVRERLAVYELSNVELVQVSAEEKEYVAPIKAQKKESLDFVFVDGLSELRGACAVAALPKIRGGGFLIVDDIQRYLPSNSRSPGALGPDSEPANANWVKAAEKLEEWPCTWICSGVQDTAVWRKPSVTLTKEAKRRKRRT